MINSIRLKNFRKHEDFCIEFDKNFNLIHGRNNAGKSTIFYAVEYCLFGNVLGFKKISQLATFKKKVLGVELIFEDKKRGLYKLQRMHKLVGKKLSANGFFTLKKILNEDEIYIMASDFGDREEDLSLKINELTGITKRFFETGIHFHQGTISEILNGSKKLDIVFGISAATTLADTFKSRALTFEKETANIETLRVKLDQYKKDKGEKTEKAEKQTTKVELLQYDIQEKENNLNSLQKTKTCVDNITQSLETYKSANKKLEETKLKIEIINNQFQEIKKNYGTHSKLKKNLNSTQNSTNMVKEELNKAEIKIEQIQKEIRESENKKIDIENKIKNRNEISDELKKTIEKLGKKEDLITKLETHTSEIKEISNTINELESESIKLQNSIRDSEREIGDIEGMLKRRNDTKDKPKCEYCGAPIDPQKIKEVIKTLKKKLQDLEKGISKNDNKEKSVKSQLVSLREKEKNFNNEIHLLENSIEQIQNLEEKKNNISLDANLEEQLQLINELIKNKEKSFENEKNQLPELRSKEIDLLKQLNILETQLKQLEEFENKVNESNSKYKIAEKNLKSEKIKFIESLNIVRQDLKKEIKDKKEPASIEIESQTLFANAIFQAIDNLDINLENFSFEKIVSIRDELRDLILTKNSEIKAKLEITKNQLSELEGGIEDIQKEIMKLDKEIAFFEKEINLLMEKISIAENYRKFHNIFKEVQNLIRENASKALEKRILSIHQKLSSDDEFEKVYIDSDNYNLSVVPKGMNSDDYYPASVYQGGGHKLILGLSYKIAIGEIIGSPPFLLVDEPTEFMDSDNRLKLLSNLNSISDNTQVLLITHQDVEKIQCNKKIDIKK